jgi:hypothetical protein
MGHTRSGHDTLPAPLLLRVIPLRQCRLRALLPVLPFLIQILRRGGLLPPVVLLRVLHRLLVLPVIWRRGVLLPSVVLLVLRRPCALLLAVTYLLPVLRR